MYGCYEYVVIHFHCLNTLCLPLGLEVSLLLAFVACYLLCWTAVPSMGWCSSTMGADLVGSLLLLEVGLEIEMGPSSLIFPGMVSLHEQHQHLVGCLLSLQTVAFSQTPFDMLWKLLSRERGLHPFAASLTVLHHVNPQPVMNHHIM